MKPEKTDLEDLRSKAENLKATMPPDHSPVVIEFAGSPKAGKSTTIEILSHFFKRTGFKVWAPTEGASNRTPYHLKQDLVAFNTWTLNYAISELLVAYFNVDHQNLVILDRGPHDALAWMRLLHKKKEIGDDELQIVRDFALHPRWSKLISRVYLFQCDPKTSLQREGEYKLIQRSGTAMNEPMLKDLLEQYEQLKTDLKPEVLKSVYTSDETTPIQTSYEIAVDVLGLFPRTSEDVS